jgi:hypothetical protein
MMSFGTRRRRPSSRPGATPPTTVVVTLRAAADRALWARLVQFDPSKRCRIPLDIARDVDAWLVTWLPGQHTGRHVHGGSGGAFVVDGILTERRAAVDRGGPPESSRSPISTPTSTHDFSTARIHLLQNKPPRPAVTPHVYTRRPEHATSYRIESSTLVAR